MINFNFINFTKKIEINILNYWYVMMNKILIKLMTIVQITSTNPRLGYLIRKNPNSLPQLKQIRSGVAFGYYTHDNNKTVQEQEYNVYFQDQMDSVSYKESENQEECMDYTNKLRFMSPQCVLDILDNFFSSNLRNADNICDPGIDDKHNTDGSVTVESYEYRVFVNLIWMKPAAYRLFSLSLDNFVKATGIIANCGMRSNNIYYIEISGKSLQFILNILQILVVLVILKNKIFPQINLDSISSKLKVSIPIISTSIPYFVAYMLLSRIDVKTFKAIVPYLSLKDTTFFHGALNDRRFYFVRDEISKQKQQIDNIIDIGSGEGRYLSLLNSIKNMNTKKITYHCVDIDDNVISKLKSKAEKFTGYNINIIKSKDNACLAPHLNQSLSLNNNQFNVVIMIEVIEHMESEADARTLLKNVIEHLPFSKLIVTTPNREFNVHYNLDGFRHDDHKFEFTGSEFLTFITECCKVVDCSFNIHGIGDIINGITPTQCAIINKIAFKK